jgi:UDP-glucose 4-epimerase
MRVLVTGGTGFVGSHTVVELLTAGHQVAIVDNLANSRISVLDRIGLIAGVVPQFHNADVRDSAALDPIFSSGGFDAVMHFAALKAVGDSVAAPLDYYDNNVAGTVSLLQLASRHGVRKFVFSSSCTVYGDPETLPVTEDSPVGKATNPYGWTKIMMEQVLIDLHHSDPLWNIALLRYFNPVGSHPSGLIGEDPSGVPTNLMPYISRVAAGHLPILQVFGDDYPTRDGTAIRDYIHVSDLATGHVQALDALGRGRGLLTYNLGTGEGSTVLEVISAFMRATGRPVPYEIVGRRAGDVAATWGDVSKAARELSWKAGRNLEDMCADMWRWQQYADKILTF